VQKLHIIGCWERERLCSAAMEMFAEDCLLTNAGLPGVTCLDLSDIGTDGKQSRYAHCTRGNRLGRKVVCRGGRTARFRGRNWWRDDFPRTE